MFGKRYDGRLVKNIDPMQRITPYIMKERNDAMNMFQETIDCEGMDEYIAKREAEGRTNLNYMTIWIAAAVRLIALKPQLNRFIMNSRIYARPKIWISFVVHQTLRTDDAGSEIKLCFDGTESIDEIADIVEKAVISETTKKTEENATDKLANLIMSLPSWLIRLVVNTLMWMDKHNIMPKAVIEASPFHTTLFLTNLKSLGINHVFHHVYNFGTTGLFIAIGKEKKLAIAKGDEVMSKKCMNFGFVSDERFCDGLYFARALKLLKKFLKNPSLLEEKLEAKVEDVK